MSQRIKEAIVLTAEYYRTQLSPGVLKLYASDLEDLPENQVCNAYERYRRNPANRTNPLPAQIRELVNPDEFVAPETQARETAGRIIGAVSRYGWANAKAAELFIGPEGWAVVQSNGGWSHLCEVLSASNEATFKAQFRDQLDGIYRHGIEAIEKSIGALSDGQARRGELTPFREVLQLIGQKPNPEFPPAG